MAYAPLPMKDRDDTDFDTMEAKGFSYCGIHNQGTSRQSKWQLTAKIVTLLNLFYTITFVAVTYFTSRGLVCVPGPSPPWSPLRDDGVIRNINTAYKPEKIFQSETSDEVEAAWDGWLKEHDELVLMPIEETKNRLPITIDAFLDPGYAVYGLAVYHQIHCLNYIRKTFYPDKFFRNRSREEVTFHKNHCFDMLRQALICHADISMLHWWNRTYSYIDRSGNVQLTDHYLNLTGSQRTDGAVTMWDTQVQCRDLEPINAWVKSHKLDGPKYDATVGQIK